MCAQAKDSSRRFSWSSPAPHVSAAGGESPPLTQMKSDRGDEDDGYCKSLSLIVKAACLLRLNRQCGLFRQRKTTLGKRISQLRQNYAPAHSAHYQHQTHGHGGLGIQVALLRWIRTSGWVELLQSFTCNAPTFILSMCVVA